MTAHNNGLMESRKFLKKNEAVSLADFTAKGVEMAQTLYKREETRNIFVKAWQHEGKYHVFCSDRQFADAVQNCLHAINAYNHFCRVTNKPGYYILDSQREQGKRLHKNYDKAWAWLAAAGIGTAHLYDDGGWIHAHEIIIAAAEQEDTMEDLHPDMNKQEKEIVLTIIDDAMKSGYSITVYDGVEYAIKRSTDKHAIFAAMFSTGSDALIFHAGQEERIGMVYLIWGNGADVIHDYSDNGVTEALLKNAQALADKYAG